MGLGWSDVWKMVLEIVAPTAGEVLKIIALHIWEIVEEWAKGLAKKGEKPPSDLKAAKFLALLEVTEPGLSQDKARLVLDTAHAQKTRRRGKTAGGALV